MISVVLILRCEGESGDLWSVWKHLPHPERLPQDDVEPAAPSFTSLFTPPFFFFKFTWSVICHVDLYKWTAVRAVQGCESSFFSSFVPLVFQIFFLKNRIFTGFLLPCSDYKWWYILHTDLSIILESFICFFCPVIFCFFCCPVDIPRCT